MAICGAVLEPAAAQIDCRYSLDWPDSHRDGNPCGDAPPNDLRLSLPRAKERVPHAPFPLPCGMSCAANMAHIAAVDWSRLQGGFHERSSSRIPGNNFEDSNQAALPGESRKDLGAVDHRQRDRALVGARRFQGRRAEAGIAPRWSPRLYDDGHSAPTDRVHEAGWHAAYDGIAEDLHRGRTTFAPRIPQSGRLHPWGYALR